jgi:hypothetical protein
MVILKHIPIHSYGTDSHSTSSVILNNLIGDHPGVFAVEVIVGTLILFFVLFLIIKIILDKLIKK